MSDHTEEIQFPIPVKGYGLINNGQALKLFCTVMEATIEIRNNQNMTIEILRAELETQNYEEPTDPNEPNDDIPF